MNLEKILTMIGTDLERAEHEALAGLVAEQDADDAAAADEGEMVE